MEFQKWPKREPLKHFFPVPNEIFILGLSPGEIAVYCYLLRTEDRQTFQCYPSYEAIGKAVGVSRNTVAKYVRSLEEKGLIRTEPTVVRSKDGRLLNGNLLYTICPIQAAVESFYERQLRQVEEDTARRRAAERLAESARRSPQNALCAPLGEPAELDTPSGVESGFGPLSGAFPKPTSESLPGVEEKAGTKEKAG